MLERMRFRLLLFSIRVEIRKDGSRGSDSTAIDLVIRWGQTLPLMMDTRVRLAICDSLSRGTVLFSDLGASALESQSRKPDPGFGLPRRKRWL
jgi:hypothetical protein